MLVDGSSIRNPQSAIRNPQLSSVTQQLRPFSSWKALDRISQRRSRNPGTVRPEVPFESDRVSLARFAKRPADRLLNQIFAVRVQSSGGRVQLIKRETSSRKRDQSDDRRSSNPHVRMRRTGPQARGRLRIVDEQRADERTADVVRCRPVCRVALCEPSLPAREQRWRERTMVASDDLDADGFRFEMTVDHENVGKGHRIVDRPVPVRVVNGTGERAHLFGPDVVEGKVLIASKIATRVEITGFPAHPTQLAHGSLRGPCYVSFRRMKHLRWYVSGTPRRTGWSRPCIRFSTTVTCDCASTDAS